MLTIRPRPGADHRQERLGDGQQAHHVDFLHPAEGVERKELQRPRHRDPSVVDEEVQAAIADLHLHCSPHCGDLPGIGDVESDAVDAAVPNPFQPCGVGIIPHPSEHPISETGQPFGTGQPDAGGGPGNQCGGRMRGHAGMY